MDIGPFFVEPSDESPAGIDFLGLRQVNQSLAAYLFPGITNTTRRLRPYSLMPWTAWAALREAEKRGKKDLSPSTYKSFREKMEILFGWSHQLRGAGGGLVGNRQKRPAGGKRDVRLRFSDWKRKVSWLDAATYGPSLKNEGGLEFLAQHESGITVPTALGKAMAASLDERLKTRPGYRAALSPEDTFDEKNAEAWFGAWDIDSPTPDESKIFREAFYDQNKVGEITEMGRRSTSVKLVLLTLERLKRPATHPEIRRYLAYADVVPRGIAGAEPLLVAQRMWRVLQTRQAQRLALEVLFAWVEQTLIDGKASDTDDLGELLTGVLSPSGRKALVVESRLGKLRRSAGTCFYLGNKDPETDIFERIDAIEQALKDDVAEATQMAFDLLLLCSIHTEQLLTDPEAAKFVDRGRSIRISLSKWHDFVKENEGLQLNEFLSAVVGRFLVSQHLMFASARYNEGQQRQHLGIEERGLISLLPDDRRIWRVTVTGDRLHAALSLMADCRLAKRKRAGNIEHFSAH